MRRRWKLRLLFAALLLGLLVLAIPGLVVHATAPLRERRWWPVRRVSLG